MEGKVSIHKPLEMLQRIALATAIVADDAQYHAP